MNGITRQLGFIVVMVAVPLICWQFVFTPQHELIESINHDITLRQQKLDDIESTAADLQELEAIDARIEAAASPSETQAPE